MYKTTQLLNCTLVALCLAGASQTASGQIAASVTPAGSWTPLANLAPEEIHMMLLLSDGTVMAQAGGGDNLTTTKHWYRLTPDANGSYIKGTWSGLASMSQPRTFFQSLVLTDGRVFVSGTEAFGDGAS